MVRRHHMQKLGAFSIVGGRALLGRVGLRCLIVESFMLRSLNLKSAREISNAENCFFWIFIGKSVFRLRGLNLKTSG